MKTIGHKPRKRFGQHFLHDFGVIHSIVTAVAPQASDDVIEIGPGLGALTLPLLSTAGQLTVVELDRDVIPILISKCQGLGELNVIQADVLNVDFTKIGNDSKKRIVGNLPYNISTPLIFHLLMQIHVIKDMHFMLQKEVVDRLAAQPGSKDYGRLSVMVQYQCQVAHLFDVGPESFQPPPKVESAVVRLTPYQQIPYEVVEIKQLEKIVRQAFSQRRKTIWNNLKPLLVMDDLIMLEIDPKLRPEQLTIADYVRLTQTYHKLAVTT